MESEFSIKPGGVFCLDRTLQFYKDDLSGLSQRGRFRSLSSRMGVDFSSNDYLGLANSARLRNAVVDALSRGVAVGSGGSRLLRGNDPEHEQLEIEAAQFFGAEASLYLSSGYAANLALFGSLPQRGDIIVHDALVHASARDGFRLSRAISREVPHNSIEAFDTAISSWRRTGGKGRPWIAVESLYSMDGDQAPLRDLLNLAELHDGMLVVDEAHATGILGKTGRGLSEDLKGHGNNVVTLHTCGKALGCEGALLCMPSVLRDFVVNRGRPFIFGTAPSPLMAAAVREALRCVGEEAWRRNALWDRIWHAEHLFAACGLPTSKSQIIPVILGADDRTMLAAQRLQAAGYDVRGIRPPTVPLGQSRLRISLTLNSELQDIDELVTLIREIL